MQNEIPPEERKQVSDLRRATVSKMTWLFQTVHHKRNNMKKYFTEKNGFVTATKLGATKLGTTNEFFVASTKNFAAATKRFFDRPKHFVVTKYFCYLYFNKSI